MKARDPGYWYQARMNVTNLNIFSNLTTSELVDLTTDVCLHHKEDFSPSIHQEGASYCVFMTSVS